VAVVGAHADAHWFSAALRSRGMPTVYGGAVRVYAPQGGVRLTDAGEHPLITVYEEHADLATEKIVNALERVRIRHPASGPRPLRSVPKPASVPDGESHRLPATAAGGAAPAGSRAQRPARPDAPAPFPVFRDPSALLARAHERLARAHEQIDTLRRELTAEIGRSRELSGQLETAREQLAAARRAQQRQRPDRASRTQHHRPVVFADPERQLRHEIHLTWLETVAEAEREDWPLRSYTLGEDFLASLATSSAARDKILEVAVQVITRRAGQVPAREVRQFGSGRTGPQRKRDDGASAWRANIATKTPQAPRFLWWELPDGRVELGKAAAHDDLSLN